MKTFCILKMHRPALPTVLHSIFSCSCSRTSAIFATRCSPYNMPLLCLFLFCFRTFWVWHLTLMFIYECICLSAFKHSPFVCANPLSLSLSISLFATLSSFLPLYPSSIRQPTMQLHSWILSFKFISDDERRPSCHPRDIVVGVAGGVSSALTFCSTFAYNRSDVPSFRTFSWPISPFVETIFSISCWHFSFFVFNHNEHEVHSPNVSKLLMTSCSSL